MKAFVAVLCLAVAASASHADLGWGHGVHHHIPSGSIGVSHDGAVIAGPAGSVRTDNGLHGHGAGAVLSGPAGEVGTHGGLARLDGPGIGHHGIAHHGLAHHGVVAPVVVAAPIAYGAWGGAATHGLAGAWGGAVAHGVAGAWGHGGVAHGLGGHWGHGIVAHGHHGW